MEAITIVLILILIICTISIIYLLTHRIYFSPVLNGGNIIHDNILETISKRRYIALSKLFKTDSIDYNTYKQLSRNYRNEVELYIQHLKLTNISHHSAGDKFTEPTGKYYITDDVVGLNNYLQIQDFLNIPPNINNYVLIAFITKTYDTQFINYETYSYPKLNPQYNTHKKSYPYYLHAMYERRDNPKQLITTTGKWIEPKIRTFPHYGSDCVFNSYTSMLSLCTDITDQRFKTIINTPNSNTIELEKEFGYDYHDPFNMNILLNLNTYDKNKWLITHDYINSDTNLNIISNRVKQYNYELIGATIMVSRIGNWNDFFHQIAYSTQGYIADDMTYIPHKVSPEQLDTITLSITSILLKRCK